MVASWAAQLGAAVRRNVLIKFRDGSQTVQEIFLPVYITALLLVLKLVQPEYDLAAVPMAPAVNATCMPVTPGAEYSPTTSLCANPHVPAGNTLLFAPLHPALGSIMQRAAEDMALLYPTLPKLEVLGVESADAVPGFYRSHPAEMFAAVDFDVDPYSAQDVLPSDLGFTVRINGSEMPDVGIQVASKEECRGSDFAQGFFSACQSQKYMTSGFLAVQSAVTRAIAAHAWNGTVCENQRDSLFTEAVQMLIPPFHRSFATLRFELFTAMYMVWALVPLLQICITQLVQEKETLLKDCMLLMGLREPVYWLSWMLTYAGTSFLTALVLAGIAKLSTLFAHSNMWAVLFVIYPYCLSLVALSCALTPLFTSAQRAGGTASLLLLIGSLLIIPIQLLSWPSAACYPLMLFSPVSFTIAISNIVQAEGTPLTDGGGGLHWWNFWSDKLGIAPGDAPIPVTVGACVVSFLVDTLLYLFLAWYLDNVWPHPQRGAKMHPGFVLSYDYWFPPSTRKNIQYTQLAEEEEREAHKGADEREMVEMGHADRGTGKGEGASTADEESGLGAEESEEAAINTAPSSSDAPAPEDVAVEEAAAADTGGQLAGTHGPNIQQVAVPGGRRPALVLDHLSKSTQSSHTFSWSASLLSLLLPGSHTRRTSTSVSRGSSRGVGRRYRIRKGGWLGRISDAFFAAGSNYDADGEAGATEPLRSLSLNVQAGEVFAFLGHQGSGVSSVLGILQGLFKPSAGEAFLHGFSLTRGDSFLHSLLGICPPSNLNLPYLTVREQLRFFAAIKGRLEWVGPATARSSNAPGGSDPESQGAGAGQAQDGGPGGAVRIGTVEEVLAALDLESWADKLVFQLSPSQQRKLTVGIALVGNPEMLLLEEPTLGMDEPSKKQVWDVLRQLGGAGRVVLLGTRSMEEADSCADRTAILSHGTLKCCGTSLYLRNQFGLSYLLHLRLGAGFQAEQLQRLQETVARHVPSAQLTGAASRRVVHSLKAQRRADGPRSGRSAESAPPSFLTFRLPMTQASGGLGPLLAELAQQGTWLGVDDGALEATTLEEVFLRFQDEGEEEAGVLPLETVQDEGAGGLEGGEGEGLMQRSEEEDDHPMAGLWRRGPDARAAQPSEQEAHGETAGNGDSATEAGPSDAALLPAGAPSSSSPEHSAPESRPSSAPEVPARPAPRYGTKKKNLLRRQTLAMFLIRLLAYRRSLWSTLGTFGVPLAFLGGALFIQSLFMQSHDYTAAMPLGSAAYGVPYGASDGVPIFYTAPDKQGMQDAHRLLSTLGDNHAHLDEAHFMERFATAWENTAPNAAGLNAVGVQFKHIELAACRLHYVVVHQPWRVDALPSFKAVLDSAFMKVLADMHGLTGAPQSVRLASYPLYYESLPYVLGFFLAFCTGLGLLLVAPVLAAQVVLEQEAGIRSQLLQVNGLKGAAYWAATLAADCFLFGLCAAAIVLLGLAFGHPPFTVYALPLLLMLLGAAVPALTLLCYVLSSFFRHAQSTVSLLSLLLLVAAFVPYGVLLTTPANAFTIPHAILCALDPPYALLSGLHFTAAYVADIPASPLFDPELVLPEEPTLDYFVAHRQLYPVLLAAGGLVAAALVLFLRLLYQAQREQESTASGSLLGLVGPEMREDVEREVSREQRRVQENARLWDDELEPAQGTEPASGSPRSEGDLILCSSLGKNYGASTRAAGLGRDEGKWALRNLWLGVKRGEVLVLVGGDKSGKSTLLSCLAGATSVSYGDALVNGTSVRFSHRRDPAAVGFCPAGEMLYGFLTVREHLVGFARIKGLDEPVEPTVEELLESLSLTAEAGARLDKCKASVLRRAALAIGLLGRPPVLLLDEPCRGLDTSSRRLVWRRILEESSQRATLICTHSVEEAEALGTRVGVLLDGELKCLGTPQTLKARYGSTYTLSLAAPPSRMPAIGEHLASLFPSTPALPAPVSTAGALPASAAHVEEAVMEISLSEGGPQEPDASEDDGAQQLKVGVPVHGLRDLAQLVNDLEQHKESLGISEFTVSQPTLQQVFYNLTLHGASMAAAQHQELSPASGRAVASFEVDAGRSQR